LQAKRSFCLLWDVVHFGWEDISQMEYVQKSFISFENTANTGMVQFGVPDLKL